jgi:hypothetical protein
VPRGGPQKQIPSLAVGPTLNKLLGIEMPPTLLAIADEEAE